MKYAAVSILLLACGSEAPSGAPVDGGSAGTTSGTGGSSWQNLGCTAAQNVVSAELEQLSLDVDLSDYAAGKYSVKQTVTLRPDAAGNAVTLFGTKLLLGEASHGYAYDGQTASFCVEPFEANEAVTLSVSYVISEEHQAFPPENIYGIKRWGNPGESDVIGAYSAPFFASTWMLAPHTMPWLDPQHSGTASIGAAELTVTTPDASWSVVGPGEPTLSDNRWSFSIQGRMPLYALAFAASPHYVQVAGAPASSGVELSARVMPVNQAKVASHLAAARVAVDWMEANLAAYSWPTALTYAEVPGYPGGFEHTSAVWLGSVLLDGGSKGDFATMHETVHHWFGNDVQAASWSHFWLSEGFTEWLTVFGIGPTLNAAQASALQKKYRTDAAALSYPKQAGAPPPGPLRFANDADFATQLSQNGQLFYRYGAAFLEMVNQRLQRDHGSDLIALLKAWYAASHGASVTTEQFRDFLIAETGDSAWSTLFDEWVYLTPCPTLELGNYSFAAGQLSFEIRRTDGANQDLPSLEIVLGGSPAQAISVALPKGVSLASAQLSLPSAPTAITIDPKGFYVLRLATEAGWTGPAVGNTLP